MKNRLIVAALIRNGSKILLGKKPKGKGPSPDTWHIPGGGIETLIRAKRVVKFENCQDAMICS